LSRISSIFIAILEKFDMNTEDRFFENLITKKQLCKTMNLSLSYISFLMAEEGLPYFKIGRAVRFRGKDVVVWLQKRIQP
jgi:excisionase family DNA binding protein